MSLFIMKLSGIELFMKLRVSLWSITTGTATYIQFPIHPDRGDRPSCDQSLIPHEDQDTHSDPMVDILF
jgi:hypothetical protein